MLLLDAAGTHRRCSMHTVFIQAQQYHWYGLYLVPINAVTCHRLLFSLTKGPLVWCYYRILSCFAGTGPSFSASPKLSASDEIPETKVPQMLPVPGSKVFSRENTAGTSCAHSFSGVCTADTASTRQYFEVRYSGYFQTCSVSGFVSADAPCASRRSGFCTAGIASTASSSSVGTRSTKIHSICPKCSGA